MLHPVRAWKAWQERWTARLLQRYAAAQINHLTGGWRPPVKDVNELILHASPLVRERMRQLVRDFPPFSGAVDRITQFTIGEGILFQSRVMDADGQPDLRARTAIEDVVKRFMDECDVAGSPAFRQHYFELQQLAKRQDLESGEFLMVRERHRDQRNKTLPWGISLHETDRLSGWGARAQGNNKLAGGVEYDSGTGSIVAFHLEDDGYGKARRIPADQVVFGFHRQRPGQLRGITPFAAAIMIAQDVSDAIGAELSSFKMSSKWLAVVKTMDVQGFMKARQVTSTTGKPNEKTPGGTPIEYLENAIIEYLRPGEEIEFKSAQRGGDSFQHFSNFLLRLAGMVVGLPFELLSGNYQGVNMATLNVSRNDFAQHLAPVQRRAIFQFDQPIIYSVIQDAVLRGRLRLPGYWTDPWHYLRGVWIRPGMRPVNPLQYFKANTEAIRAGLKSPQQVILETGGDPEQVLDDIQAWRVMCEQRGLEFDLDGISTANANNPAAIAPEGDGDARNNGA